MAADTYDTYDVSYTGQAAVILRRRLGMIMVSYFSILIRCRNSEREVYIERGIIHLRARWRVQRV